MTETTARFGLPLIQIGQAQKDVTHNAAVHGLDRLMHLSVVSRGVADPPASPVIDATWIVAVGATGAWAGQVDALATWDGAAWMFTLPPEGTLCWIADEGILALYGGGTWNADFLPVAGLKVGGAAMLGAAPVGITAPTGGGTVDVEARAALTGLLVYLQAQGLLTS